MVARYLVDSSFIQVDATQRQAINNSRYSRGVRTRFVSIPPELNIHADNAQILSGALAAGLYPKILSLDGNGMRTLINQQPVSIVSFPNESSLTCPAPQLCQLQDTKIRTWFQLLDLFHHHAIQKALRLGDWPCE